MEAIILAGGKWTRLRSVVADVPKPMADINGHPFLEYLLRYLLRFGINRVIMSVGYKWQAIVNHFGHKFLSADIIYAVENEPLGTGGAIKNAFLKCENERVFVINGDTFFAVDYGTMYEFSESCNTSLTVAVKEVKNSERYGCLEIVNGYIVSHQEKSFRQQGFINGGVYCVTRNLLDGIKETTFSWENDFAAKYYRKLQPQAFISDGYFIDIGIPEDYRLAQESLPSFFGE